MMAVLIVLLFLAAGGFIVYKLGYSSSWEKGVWFLVSKLLNGIVKLFTWFFQSSNTTARQQDPSLMPTPKECSGLVEAVNAHPYEAPCVEYARIDENDIFTLKVSAFSLVERYANLKPAEIREIVCRVVSNFFASQRETIPYFYVPYARQDGFLLLIPLSEYGKQALNRKIEEAKAEAALNQARASAVVTPLTEEVPEDDSEAEE